MLDFESLITEKIPRASVKPLVPLLVVEDDRSMLPIFDRMLSQIAPGLAYHWCASLEQAKTSLRHHRYELIIADFLLDQGQNGLELFDVNAKSPDRADFVMMSTLELRRFCRVHGEGPSHVINKPLQLDQMREVLRKLLPREEDQ